MEILRKELVCSLCSLLIVTVLSVASAAEEIKPIPFLLPAPMFRDTPPNLSDIPNLEKLRKGARPAFYAPVGVTNVALGKNVTATDDMPVVGEIEMITDGDKEAPDGSFVELGPFLQHVTVDLESKCEIYAILVWHYHMQPRVMYDVVVQVADDADFTENVRTLFNNDIDNSAGLGVGDDKHYVETNKGKLIDAKGQAARYVRFYSNGNEANDLNQYIEVEVWGKPVKSEPVKEPCESLKIEYPPSTRRGEPWYYRRVKDLRESKSGYRSFMVPVGTENVALGKKVISADENPIIGSLEMITDGKKEGGDDTMVETNPLAKNIVIDLGDLYELYAIGLWRDHQEYHCYIDMIVQISCDADFTDAVTLFNNDRNNSFGLGKGADYVYLETHLGKLIDAAGLTTRYIRIWGNGNENHELNRFVEVEAYGRPYNPDADPDRLIPLNFELPTPPFISMPTNWKGPKNLEKPTGKPRQTFYAPVGTRKISLGKGVSTDHKQEPIVGDLQMITDGDKDCCKNNYVELDPFLQQVTIDLATEYEINAILLWHWLKYNGHTAYYDVIVQVSNDVEFVKGVHTVFNNDIDNSAGLGAGDDMHFLENCEGKLIDAGGVRGRYVRLWSNGNTSNDLNHYVEVEVYGR